MISPAINKTGITMATLPCIENMLLGVRGGLGLPARTDFKKSRFTNLEMSFQSHTELASELLSEIFEALEMDECACKDARGNLLEWGYFYKALELNTWTGKASEKQVLWHMLAYAYVPGLARRLAFWSLTGMEEEQPFDSGMPGGEFWFLPNWDVENNTLKLPVPQVIDWLLDLLEAPSFQEFKNVLARERFGKKGGDESVVINLMHWREGTKPQSAKLIGETFSDTTTLNFAGAFQFYKDGTDEDQFQAALACAQRRRLTPQTLRHEIPMSVERLTLVVNGTASEDEKQEFGGCQASCRPRGWF